MKDAASSAAAPCAAWEDACLEEAWGLGGRPEWDAHRRSCRRCREAADAAAALVDRSTRLAPPVPAPLLQTLPARVFARTTRGTARRTRLAWAGAGLAGAIAALAGVAVLRRNPGDHTGPTLAETDPELLQDMDLAEDLELLEVLEALEGMEDA